MQAFEMTPYLKENSIKKSLKVLQWGGIYSFFMNTSHPMNLAKLSPEPPALPLLNEPFLSFILTGIEDGPDVNKLKCVGRSGEESSLTIWEFAIFRIVFQQKKMEGVEIFVYITTGPGCLF